MPTIINITTGENHYSSEQAAPGAITLSELISKLQSVGDEFGYDAKVVVQGYGRGCVFEPVRDVEPEFTEDEFEGVGPVRTEIVMNRLAVNADEAFVAKVREALAAGTHRWCEDPMNSSVFGLVNLATEEAAVVLYADNDFDVEGEF